MPHEAGHTNGDLAEALSASRTRSARGERSILPVPGTGSILRNAFPEKQSRFREVASFVLRGADPSNISPSGGLGAAVKFFGRFGPRARGLAKGATRLPKGQGVRFSGTLADVDDPLRLPPTRIRGTVAPRARAAGSQVDVGQVDRQLGELVGSKNPELTKIVRESLQARGIDPTDFVEAFVKGDPTAQLTTKLLREGIRDMAAQNPALNITGFRAAPTVGQKFNPIIPLTR